MLAVGSALAAVVALAVPAAGDAAAATRPGPAKNLAAYQLRGPVTLRWTNPRGVDSDVVRIARGFKAPSSVTSGRGLTLPHAVATQAVLRDLAPGRAYSVSVWTRGPGGLSPRTSTTFTTYAPAPAAQDFSGRVTDTAGHPLRNAVVVVQDLALSMARIKTDAAGRFSADVGGGLALVSAQGPRATGGTSDATGYGASPVALATTGRPVHLVLPAGARVRGRVTDLAGKPVSGMAITSGLLMPYLLPNNGGFGVALGAEVVPPRSNHNGYFALRGVPATATVPCARPTATSGGVASACADASVAAAIGKTATAPTIVVEHAKTGTLSGTVTSADGHPLPHSSIRYLSASDNANDGFHGLRTDARGKYRVANLVTGRYLVCADRSRGLGYIENCRVANVQGPTRRDFTLRQGGSLSGVVRGRSGNRAGGVFVQAQEVGGQQRGFGFAVTRDDGSFTLHGLTSGNYQLCFQPTLGGAHGASFAPSCRSTPVAVTRGLSRIGADGTLPPGGAVTGVVRAADGSPLGHALVDLQLIRNGHQVGDGSAVANGRGRFAAGDLAPGRYRVCAERQTLGLTSEEQCATRLVPVAAGRTTRNAVITMAAHPSVLVHVTDAAGHALSGVDVALLRRCTMFCTVLPVFGARGMHVVDSVMTDSAGNAQFPHTAEGYYGVCAMAYFGAAKSVPAPTGYADKCTDGFPVHATLATSGSTTLELDPAGTVTGTVVDGAGHPVRNARLTIAGAATDGVPNEDFVFGPTPFDALHTDSRGRYSVHSVRPGQRSVCARATGYQRGCLTGGVTVTAGAVTAADPLALNAKAFAAATAAHPSMRTNRYEMVRYGLGSGPRSLPFEAFLHQVIRFGGAGAVVHLR